MYLADCERVLMEEIACREANQRCVARTYRMALDSCRDYGEQIDWAIIDRAIVSRWSFAGLKRIKGLALSGKCFSWLTR